MLHGLSLVSALVLGSVVACCCHTKVIHAQCTDIKRKSCVSVRGGGVSFLCPCLRVQAEKDVSTVHLSTGMALICYSETHENQYGKNSKCGLKGTDSLRPRAAGADAVI